MSTAVDEELSGEVGHEPTDDTAEPSEQLLDNSSEQPSPALQWVRILAYGVLPGVALLLMGAAAVLKWHDGWSRFTATARTESITAATESTIALLSYRADAAEQQLTAARDRLTGTFRDSYSALIQDVVIPMAQQKQISAEATVSAAASVSARPDQAVALVFVNQEITIGNDAPLQNASSVMVTLDKVGKQWLISDFTPV